MHCLEVVLSLMLSLFANASVNGFPGSSFIATISSRRAYHGGKVKIEDWNFQKSQDLLYDKGRGFAANTHGIYIIGYTVHTERPIAGSIQACISVNEESECQALTSKLNITSTSKSLIRQSLHATSLLRLFAGDVIAVQVESRVSWKLLPQSQFFGFLLQEYGMAPAFYVQPTSANPLINDRKQLVRRWGISNTKGAFLNAPSFSTNLGVFTVPKTGLYFVNVNAVFRKSGGKEVYIVTLVNGNSNIAKRTFGAREGVETFTLCIHTVLELQRGTKLFMHIRKVGMFGHSSILPGSSFSVGLLQSTSGVHGFSLKSFIREKYGAGPIALQFNKFTDKSPGGFNTLKENEYFVRKTGTYLMCMNLEVHCADASPCSVSFIVNKAEVAVYAVGHSSHLFTSRCLMISILEGDFLTIEARSPKQWYLEEGSSISLILLQETFPAFSLNSPITSNSVPNTWVKVTKISASSHGFLLFNGFNDGEFIIPKSGIYQVFANVIFSNFREASISACVAIDGNPSSSDGLLAVNTAVSGMHTLTISSAIYLKKTQHVALLVKFIGHQAWELETNSSFSMVFLGERELVIGFQTSLFYDVTHMSSGWRTPSLWNRPSDVTSKSWSFLSHAKLTQFGTFEAPVTGLYYAAANVIISKANLISDNSIFIGMIAVNDQTASDLLYVRQSRKIHPTQADVRSEFTLTISAVLHLQKGDSLSLKVCSRSDTVWMIRKETGFSVVLVSQAKPGVANGLLARDHNVSNIASSESFGNWTIAGNDPKLFKVGHGLTFHADEIFIKEKGIYAVLINIQLRNNDSEDIHLALLDTLSNTKIFCAKTKQIYATSFISCNMLLFFERVTKFKVLVLGSRESSKVIIGPASSISIFKIERPYQYPWFYAELQESIETLNKVRLDDWIWQTKETRRLLGHDNLGFLGITKGSESIGRGLVLASMNIVFDQTAKAKCTISLEDQSGNTTLASVTSRYNPNRCSKATLSMAHVVKLSLSGISQTITAPGFFIDKRSSFSMSYLPASMQDRGFMLQMKFDQTIRKSGLIPVQGWSVVDAKNDVANDIVNKDSVYFVTMTLIVEFPTDDLRISLESARNDTLLKWVVQRHTLSSSSYTFTGVFKPSITGKLQTSVQMSTGSYLNIKKQSCIQVISLGDALIVHGLILPFKSSKVTFDGTSPLLELRANKATYKNGVVIAEGTAVIRRTGIYLISASVSIFSQKRSTYELLTTINGELSSSIYSKQEIASNGTISITNSLYLQRGMFVQTFVSTNMKTTFDVLQGSTFGMILLKDLDYDVDEKLLPVIYKDILPTGNHSFPIGNPFSLKCHSAADDRIIYNWFRNGNLTQSSYSPIIKLAGQQDESGEYYCETMASDNLAMSKPVVIGFYDIDECLEGTHSCTGRNQTCINLPGSFKCSCSTGLHMNKGECTNRIAEEELQALNMDRLNLPVAVVVLAPIAIFVFIFLIVVALYTYYKSKKAATQRLIRHSGSFSEQTRLHQEEETSFCHDDRSSIAPREADESLGAKGLNRQISNKELKEVRFSLETDCDFENFDIEDDGSTSDNSAWKDDDYLSPRTI